MAVLAACGGESERDELSRAAGELEAFLEETARTVAPDATWQVLDASGTEDCGTETSDVRADLWLDLDAESDAAADELVDAVRRRWRELGYIEGTRGEGQQWAARVHQAGAGSTVQLVGATDCFHR